MAEWIIFDPQTGLIHGVGAMDPDRFASHARLALARGEADPATDRMVWSQDAFVPQPKPASQASVSPTQVTEGGVVTVTVAQAATVRVRDLDGTVLDFVRLHGAGSEDYTMNAVGTFVFEIREVAVQTKRVQVEVSAA